MVLPRILFKMLKVCPRMLCLNSYFVRSKNQSCFVEQLGKYRSTCIREVALRTVIAGKCQMFKMSLKKDQKITFPPLVL